MRITGNLGTQDIQIASSFTTAQFDAAVNAFTDDTGIYASGGQLLSIDYGSEVTISLEVTSGNLNTSGGTLSASDGIQTDSGVDVAGNISGVSFDGDGTNARVVSDLITADLEFDPTTATGNYTFTVDNSGLRFQLNQFEGPNSREQLGIRNVSTQTLGSTERQINGVLGNSITIGGFLSSLESGGTNDLNSNPTNALRILDAAITDVLDQRAYLGAFQQQTVETNLSSLEVALQELTQSESSIRDLDFAEETANFAQQQVLFQSSVAVLAQANQLPQAVLTLIT